MGLSGGARLFCANQRRESPERVAWFAVDGVVSRRQRPIVIAKDTREPGNVAAS